MKKLRKLALIPAAAALTLSACSSGDEDKDATNERSATFVTPGDGATSEATAPSGKEADLKNPVGAIDSLKDANCVADDQGTWSASGTVMNADGAAGDYYVRFSVVKEKTSEVVGDAETIVTVKAGKSQGVSFPDLYSGDGKGLACFPRVVRGTAS